MQFRSPSSVRALLAALLTLAAGSAQADTFNLNPVTINTQSLDGTSGYLLFTYGPSTEGTTPINSTVSVSGPSFSSFSIENSGASNYQLDPINFENTLTFTPTFTTTATPGADEGNIFSLFALDSSFNPATTSDPTGSNSAVMIVQYADGSVAKPVVYSPFVPVAPVPEASTATIFLLFALCAGSALRTRRRSLSY